MLVYRFFFSSVICRFNLKPKTVIYGAAREGIHSLDVWLVAVDVASAAAAVVVVVVVPLVAMVVCLWVSPRGPSLVRRRRRCHCSGLALDTSRHTGDKQTSSLCMTRVHTSHDETRKPPKSDGYPIAECLTHLINLIDHRRVAWKSQ